MKSTISIFERVLDIEPVREHAIAGYTFKLTSQMIIQLQGKVISARLELLEAEADKEALMNMTKQEAGTKSTFATTSKLAQLLNFLSNLTDVQDFEKVQDVLFTDHRAKEKDETAKKELIDAIQKDTEMAAAH